MKNYGDSESPRTKVSQADERKYAKMQLENLVKKGVFNITNGNVTIPGKAEYVTPEQISKSALSLHS